MGQREYDDFKLLVKEWKDSHPEEYKGHIRILRHLSSRIGNLCMKDTGDDRAVR